MPSSSTGELAIRSRSTRVGRLQSSDERRPAGHLHPMCLESASQAPEESHEQHQARHRDACLSARYASDRTCVPASSAGTTPSFEGGHARARRRSAPGGGRDPATRRFVTALIIDHFGQHIGPTSSNPDLQTGLPVSWRRRIRCAFRAARRVARAEPAPPRSRRTKGSCASGSFRCASRGWVTERSCRAIADALGPWSTSSSRAFGPSRASVVGLVSGG